MLQMTLDELEASVREFMETKLDLDITSEDLKYKRLRHLVEELGEFAEAQASGDEVEIADALGDLLYILVGTFLVYDLPMTAIIKEIHRSNMTKDKLNSSHKGGKGTSFQQPRLAEVIDNVRRN